VRWGLDVAVLLLVVGAVGAWQTRHLPTGGVPLPPLALRTPDGQARSLAELQGGRPAVLAVWAPWCGVCKAEVSTLSLLQRVVGGRARVLSLATAYRSPAEVERFVREQGVDYAVVLDVDGAAPVALGVESFPTTFFLSADGRIERAAVGYTTLPGLLWRLLL
jgi:thiol-disulfide isomerase/thioredoxin